jgi:hypothetical protein
MRPVGFGNLFICLFIYFIHDIVYPYTTRGWKILDYSTCCRKHHSIYDLVMFPGNTSRIIGNFQSSSCIIYENSILPLIISATGIVPQSLFKNLKILDLGNTLVVVIQKGILVYSCHIVSKFLNIDTEHNKTQQSQNVEARRR